MSNIFLEPEILLYDAMQKYIDKITRDTLWRRFIKLFRRY